jgi:hypothetical protein
VHRKAVKCKPVESPNPVRFETPFYDSPEDRKKVGVLTLKTSDGVICRQIIIRFRTN